MDKKEEQLLIDLTTARGVPGMKKKYGKSSKHMRKTLPKIFFTMG